MLPILNRPAIEYCITDLKNNGIDDILIITGKNKRSIEDHFDKSLELEQTLHNKQKINYL